MSTLLRSFAIALITCLAEVQIRPSHGPALSPSQEKLIGSGDPVLGGSTFAVPEGVTQALKRITNRHSRDIYNDWVFGD